ncbi:hypothetical protein TrLO_g8842 [Triparma laevis f. longispina]|uniref:Uncharacterized protein n=1 Tax=Triparma laevis f. longispina TaxID=1714387 RepID=A0A9W7E7H7_9STRA|nr:hypothetical protein TrLO_g8842 [Triparma laevis f. longispina]
MSSQIIQSNSTVSEAYTTGSNGTPYTNTQSVVSSPNDSEGDTDIEDGQSIHSHSSKRSYNSNFRRSGGKSFDSDVRDWEYGLTRVNLGLAILYLGTVIAAFSMYFTGDVLPEYNMKMYYSAASFNTNEQKWVLIITDIVNMPIQILCLCIQVCGFMNASVTVLPFINHLYFNKMEKGKNHLKWFEHSVSVALINTCVALAFGQSDITTIIPIVGCTLAWSYCLMIFESVNTSSGVLNINPVKLPFMIACLIGMFVIPPVFLSYHIAYTNNQWNDEVYWQFTVFGLAMSHHVVTMINMLFYFRGSGKWGIEGYEFCEKFHNVQSFIFKQAITWTVIYTGRGSSS